MKCDYCFQKKYYEGCHTFTIVNTIQIPLVRSTHPFFLKADESFIIISLELLRRLTDQSIKLSDGWPRLQEVQDVGEGGLSTTCGQHHQRLQAVALLFGKVNKHLGR